MSASENPFQPVTVHLDASECQAVVLALARLSVARPGWFSMLQEIAGKFSPVSLFEAFRTYAGPPPGFPQETGNRFEVVRQGEMIVALNMSPEHGQFVFTLEEAMQLAAWMAMLADPDQREFHRLIQEIKK